MMGDLIYWEFVCGFIVGAIVATFSSLYYFVKYYGSLCDELLKTEKKLNALSDKYIRDRDPKTGKFIKDV